MGLRLKLLGEFALRDESGAELSLPTRKTRALLGYLAVNADRPQPRERLMALLWSDRAERQARQSLNQALLSIRKLEDGNGAALLDSDSERVTLRGEAVECDVTRLRSLIEDDPAEAATLYVGTFLDGLSVPDPAFEEWLLATRSEFHALACDALKAATKGYDSTVAIDCARRLVALDPLREDAHRRLMELLQQSGDRAGALRQYQACAEILQRELQVEPDVATKMLFEEIRQETRRNSTPEPPPVTRADPASPAEPSLAVLPFDVIGGDPQTTDLADGLVEDLITALAKVRDLLVIDRYSTENYRGRSVNVQEAARTLGVRYILTGSIRTIGNRLRCSVQLVDSISGRHVWAERYDRTVDDIFGVQDEIVRHVLIEMQVNLTQGEHARIAARGTNNFEAWMLCIQGESQLHGFSQENIVRARELFEAAHRVDPSWARPVAGIASCHYYEARFSWGRAPEDSIARGLEYADKAVTADPGDPLGYLALRSLNVLLGKHDEALALCEKALSVAPNDYQTRAVHAMTLLMSADDPTGAVAALERAVRLGPIPRPWVQFLYGLALQVAGYTDRAIRALENLVEREADHLDGHAILAAAYISAYRPNDAQATIERLRERDPTYSIARALTRVYFRNQERTDWLRALLVKAGLPEGDTGPRP